MSNNWQKVRLGDVCEARVIFKSWFEDFEPFEGGEFVESELGMIPKRWRVGNLIDIADYMNGLTM